MAEDSHVPPLSRRVPGAVGGPAPPASIARPVLSEPLLRLMRAAVDAAHAQEAAQPDGAAQPDAVTQQDAVTQPGWRGAARSG